MTSGAPRVPLLPILSVNFVGTLGFSVVLPFLVFLVTRWGGNAFLYGLIGATYSIFQLIGAPLLGRWSDRFGRRRILLLSHLGSLVSWLIFLVAFFLPQGELLGVDSRWLGRFTLTLPLIAVFLARAADGLTGGNVSVASAYLADISDDENRTENFGKLAASSNLGYIAGPAVAGLLGATAWGEISVVLAAVAISVVAALIIWLRLPESSPCALAADPEETNVRKVFGQEPRACYELRAAEKLGPRGIWRLEGIPYLLTIYFLVMLAFNLFYVAFPVHAEGKLGWEVSDTGLFYAALGLMMALAQGPLLGRLSKKMSDKALVIAGSISLGSSFLCLVSPRTAVIYLGVVLLASGSGVMWPSVLSILAARAGARRRGAVQGFADSIGASASVLGLIAGGLLYGSLAGWTFSLSAGLIFVVTLSAPGFLRSRPGLSPV